MLCVLCYECVLCVLYVVFVMWHLCVVIVCCVVCVGCCVLCGLCVCSGCRVCCGCVCVARVVWDVCGVTWIRVSRCALGAYRILNVMCVCCVVRVVSGLFVM